MAVRLLPESRSYSRLSGPEWCCSFGGSEIDRCGDDVDKLLVALEDTVALPKTAHFGSSPCDACPHPVLVLAQVAGTHQAMSSLVHRTLVLRDQGHCQIGSMMYMTPELGAERQYDRMETSVALGKLE